MAATPQWASDLLATVWAAEGSPARRPDLKWRRQRAHHTHVTRALGLAPQQPSRYSSGRGNALRVQVTAGTDRHDQRLVLLHEIAHALRHMEAESFAFGHDYRFWQIAWHLYRQYRGPVPLRTFLDREQTYRVGALVAAADAGIPGARARMAARTNRKETTTMAKAKTTVPAGQKRCPGIPKLGEAPHTAALAKFGKNAAHPDGYTRLCIAHKHQYAAAWAAEKKAAAAAAADGQPVPTQTRAAAVRTKPVLAAVPDQPDDEPGETPAATERRRQQAAAVEAAGTETAEGQALLKAGADEAAEARRATRRAQQIARRAAAKAKAAEAVSA